MHQRPTDAEADRAFFRDVLEFPYVDAGRGWLIFATPPAEVAFHPHDKNDLHQFYLMCDDIEAFIARMGEADTPCTDVHLEPWGKLVSITLPGGGKLGVYQPLHPLAHGDSS